MADAGTPAHGGSRLLADLVKVVLPASDFLAADAQTVLEKDVLTFVAGQVSSLPVFLRLPYRLALFLFNWLAFLRYGRSYTALARPRQESYVLWWTNSPSPQMRDVIRLVRSCALLQYWDHPSVRAHLEGEVRE